MSEPVKLAPGEHVWARWCGLVRTWDDRVDHIYTDASAARPGGVFQECRPRACVVVPWHGLNPAKGRRCKQCERWLARHPEVVVRDMQEAAG